MVAIATGARMSLHTEFDKGSLIWVKGEIEETFGRAKEALQSFAADGNDASLKHTQTYLHQARGALTLVDLTGLARFCEEIEQVVVLLSGERLARMQSRCCWAVSIAPADIWIA